MVKLNEEELAIVHELYKHGLNKMAFKKSERNVLFSLNKEFFIVS